MAFSTTILDSIIPFAYGECEATGLCAGLNPLGQYAYLIYIFAFGEQDSITDCKINGEAIGGLPWVSSIFYRYGTGSETMPSLYSTMGTDANFEKFAYVCFKVDSYLADVPGTLNVTATLGGQKCYDWRTATTIQTANLGVIAYDIQTNANWKGIAASRIDTDQWEPFADWCDEAMSDSTARYEFNGLIYQRDPEAATTEVLSHGFAKTYFGADNKLKIWSEADPPAITGAWSATASATITEDTTTGAATTDVKAGSILYVGTNVRTVVSVTDDDTIVLDAAVTVSGVTVRKTSGIYIRRENWVTFPAGSNIAPGSIPDEEIINHSQNGSIGGYQYPAPVNVTGDKRNESTHSGCNNASQARRASTTKTNLMTLQPFNWNGTADGIAGGLEPGDIFFFDDDVLTMQPARALPPVTRLLNNHYALSLREYDPAANSTATETDDTPPTIASGWVTDDPDAPTAATQTFGEAGSWDAASGLPDPDDLTGWTDSAGISGAYSAPNDLTTFTVSTPATATSYSPAIGGAASGLKLIKCLAKASATGFTINVVNTAHTATKATSPVVPADSLWHPIVIAYDGLSSDEMLVSGIAASASDTLQVRRARAVDWIYDPSLALYERWEWTEHGSASTSVKQYRMVDTTDIGIVLDVVPTGSTVLEYTHLTLGSTGSTTQWGTGARAEATMRAVGPNGGTAAFPTPTQAIESRAGKIIVDPSSFTRVLGSTDTSLEEVLSTVDEMGDQFPSRQQVMSGEKTGITDNTITKIITFTMPTGPSKFMAAISVAGECQETNDIAAVWIQGVLKCVRNSSGSVSAVWTETLQEEIATGTVTFGVSECSEVVSSADVEFRVILDCTISGYAWDVKWTALMSDDITVTPA